MPSASDQPCLTRSNIVVRFQTRTVVQRVYLVRHGIQGTVQSLNLCPPRRTGMPLEDLLLNRSALRRSKFGAVHQSANGIDVFFPWGVDQRTFQGWRHSGKEVGHGSVLRDNRRRHERGFEHGSLGSQWKSFQIDVGCRLVGAKFRQFPKYVYPLVNRATRMTPALFRSHTN